MKQKIRPNTLTAASAPIIEQNKAARNGISITPTTAFLTHQSGKLMVAMEKYLNQKSSSLFNIFELLSYKKFPHLTSSVWAHCWLTIQTFLSVN